MIRTPRAKLAATALLGVVAVSSLSGCGTMQAGAAVIIGGQRTTDGQIQAQVNQFQSFAAAYNVPAQDSGTVAQSQIDLLLEAAIWQRVADNLGLKVTPAEVAQERTTLVNDAQQSIAQNMPGFKGSDDEAVSLAVANSQNPSTVPPGQVENFIAFQAVIHTVIDAEARKLGVDPSDTQALGPVVVPMLNTAAAQLKIKVSPRYGSYDASTQAVDAAAPAWIRTAAAAPVTAPAQAPANQ